MDHLHPTDFLVPNRSSVWLPSVQAWLRCETTVRKGLGFGEQNSFFATVKPKKINQRLDQTKEQGWSRCEASILTSLAVDLLHHHYTSTSSTRFASILPLVAEPQRAVGSSV